MGRPWRRWVRPLGAVALLGVLVWRLGTGPFLDGLRLVDPRAVLAAVAIALVTTVCAAWRWRLVSSGLGADLRLRDAVPACYSAQFLNTVLPGGVAGDVHRGVGHGRAVHDVGRAVRAVGWERTAGQAVQVLLTVVVLVLLPSPVQWLAGPVAAALAVVAVAVVLLARLPRGRDPGRVRRLVDTVAADVRCGLLRGRLWIGVGLASAVAVAGHAATLLLAMRVAGSQEPLTRLLPLALLMLVAMSVPLSLFGMGPREGVAAWTFSAAGLGAGQGVTTAVVYGVMAIAATLPGAVVLVAARRRSRRPGDVSVATSVEGPAPVVAGSHGHG